MVKQRVREEITSESRKYYPEYRWMWIWFKYDLPLSILGYCATLEVAREVLERVKPKPKPVTAYHSAVDTKSWPRGGPPGPRPAPVQRQKEYVSEDSSLLAGGGYQPRKPQPPLNRDVRDGCPVAKPVGDE